MNINYNTKMYSGDYAIQRLKFISGDLHENNPLTYVYILQNPFLSEEDREKYNNKLELLKNQYDRKWSDFKEKLINNGATTSTFEKSGAKTS